MSTIDQAIEMVIKDASPEQRQTLLAVLDEKCGGPGSGVPGPCPQGGGGSGNKPEVVESKYSLSYEYHKERRRLDRPAAKKEIAKAGIPEGHAVHYQGSRGNTSVPYNVSADNIRKTLIENGYRHTKQQEMKADGLHVKYDGFENAKGVRITTNTIQSGDTRYSHERLNQMPWVDVSKPKKAANA